MVVELGCCRYRCHGLSLASFKAILCPIVYLT
ncbi:mCG147977 [Mus musculus]|nr:mCG147977 [Mus musculus]